MDILEILGRVGFDWRMALFSVINFLIVYAILHKFVFTSLGKAISERQQTIDEGLENAQKVKVELSNAEAKAQDIIKEAKKEGNEVIKKYQDDASKVAEKIKLDAQNEVEDMYKKSKEQIEVEKAKMVEGIKDETANLAIMASEQILKKKLSKDEDKKLIEDFLAQINTK